MARVTGIGGVFLRSHDPKRLREWYTQHLGLRVEAWGAVLRWSDEVPQGTGATAWNVFSENTKYFSPSVAEPTSSEPHAHAAPLPVSTPQQVMINYRVDDLPALLKRLQAAGVWIDPKQSPDEGYGSFAWIQDCDGNRVELWEPAAKKS